MEKEDKIINIQINLEEGVIYADGIPCDESVVLEYIKEFQKKFDRKCIECMVKPAVHSFILCDECLIKCANEWADSLPPAPDWFLKDEEEGK